MTLVSIPGIPLWAGIFLLVFGGIGCLFARGSKRTIAVVATAAGVLACFHPPLPDPKTAIIGTWKNGDGEVIRFSPNGTVTTDGRKGSFVGEFLFPDSDHIILKLSRERNELNSAAGAVNDVVEPAGPALVCRYSLSLDKLVISINGEESTYQRAARE